MGTWSDIEVLFDTLEGQPIQTPATLEDWLLDQSELAECLDEESASRLLTSMCHTDDPQAEAAYLHFVEKIAPRCEPRWQYLREKYVHSPAREALDPQRYFVFDRSSQNQVELFRLENVPLQTEDCTLDQQYRKICGAMTVEYDGREQTLPQMARYLEEPDRNVRQEAWELSARRRQQNHTAIESILDKMIDLRTRIARNAGLADFRDYQFRVYDRFDYGPTDCLAFHEAVERHVVPLQRNLQAQRCSRLGVETLRPWDLAVDPRGRPPLRPFENIEQLTGKCSQIFHRIDPHLGAQFDMMIEAGWLDLASRKGKAPGGCQMTFDASRHPFIFMNASSMHRDVMTLLHEAGHAFHYLACRDQPLITYRHAGMEMAEVASMGMEMIALDHLDVFYKGEELARAKREHFESLTWLFPWVATIDAFQHWLYTHPNHTRRQREDHWLSLLDRFGGIEDWTGYEDLRRQRWQRQLHLFGVPFYYIEYGIAQIGALQLWQQYRQNPPEALCLYRQALALGGSRPLPELWAAAGWTFDFSERILEPLTGAVLKELEQLPN
jgi:oligoendopeptidase F